MGDVVIGLLEVQGRGELAFEGSRHGDHLGRVAAPHHLTRRPEHFLTQRARGEEGDRIGGEEGGSARVGSVGGYTPCLDGGVVTELRDPPADTTPRWPG